jgi:hypothetical protein
MGIDGFDAAEVDADGRIAVLLTFGGASPSSSISWPSERPSPKGPRPSRS